MTRLLVSAAVFYAALLIQTSRSDAGCVCSCVNGQVQALCSSTFEIAPVCMPRVCPIVMPSIQPIRPPIIPPIGTSNCGPRQVFNPFTSRYEWKTICQ